MRPVTSVAIVFASFAVATAVRAQTYFPPPTDPVGNPTTPQKALLGQALFWDEQLSSSRTIACGTCHVFGRGGVDPRTSQPTHPGPDGVFGTADDIRGSHGVVLQDAAGAYVPSALFGIRPQSTTRRAPSPVNAAYETNLFWDGRASDTFTDPVSNTVLLTGNAALESQAADPPVSDVEMGHMGRSWTDVANDIASCTPLALASSVPPALATFVSGQTYAMLFQQVYGSPGVTSDRIVFAIAAYERTLIADQSPYDLYLAGAGILGAQELSGLAAFQQFCMTCHRDLLPGSHTTGPALNDFRRIGLRPDTDDAGRQAVTNNPNDLGRFKVPQLRNVALRAPYMHTGGLSSFFPVIDFYNRGGDFGPNIDPMVAAIAGQIGPQTRADISAFLQILTDPRVQLEQPPFDRPHLWSEGSLVPTTFGTGGPGTGGFTPTNQVIPPPFLGNGKFMLAMDRALPGAPTFLIIDVASSTTPTPVLGHNYYLSPNPNVVFLGGALATGSAAGDGYVTLPVPIPSTPFLAGLPLFGQWLAIDPAGVSGLASSNAFGLALF